MDFRTIYHKCNCWVATRPADERACIHYGAHNPLCPTFSPALDPVDAVADAELRLAAETGIRNRRF